MLLADKFSFFNNSFSSLGQFPVTALVLVFSSMEPLLISPLSLLHLFHLKMPRRLVQQPKFTNLKKFKFIEKKNNRTFCTLVFQLNSIFRLHSSNSKIRAFCQNLDQKCVLDFNFLQIILNLRTCSQINVETTT